MLTYTQVEEAISKAGSVRGAAKLLGKPYTSVQWWLARNGLRVEVEKRAVLVPIQYELTEKAQADINEGNVA